MPTALRTTKFGTSADTNRLARRRLESTTISMSELSRATFFSVSQSLCRSFPGATTRNLPSARGCETGTSNVGSIPKGTLMT
ncbi:hypothetical protein, partial [Undibacterium sp. 10I3]|uniref:hypothetical protein n=1 Tax=Undibacterium sp. 10I3 TaxID=3048579 RepID=UPI002B23D4BF